jgi:hypothetical protein
LISDDEVMRVLEQANPASVDDPIAMLDIVAYRDVLDAKNTTMTIETETTSIPPDSHHRQLIIAAATVAIIAGGLVFAARDDDTGVAGDQLPVTLGPVTTAPYEASVDPVEDEVAGTRVGFIGLPPEGATPSTPEGGEIVVSILSCYAPIGDLSEIDPFPSLGALWVLADGRLIWLKFENLPEGANSLSTGPLEQRLTPEGVELMRSEATAAQSSGGGSLGRCFDIGRGYYSVSTGGGTPWEEGSISADNEHLARVMDPWSWLPATAWDDPEIRGYVPSTYQVTYEVYGSVGENTYSQRNLAYGLLPAAAQDLLPEPGVGWGGGAPGGGWVHGFQKTVTTDEARSLAAALDDAGFERDGLLNAYRLDYQLDIPDETFWDGVVHVRFYPMPPGCFEDQLCSPMHIGALMRGWATSAR